MKLKTLRAVLSLSTVMCILSLGGLVGTSKADITFAQFDEVDTQPFTFTNNDTSATFSGTAEGNFVFLIPGLPTGPEAATITLTSTAVTQAETGGPFLEQLIDGATNTLTFTRDSDGANLLTVTFTGNILGFNGDDNATLSSATASGDSLTYTSAFLDFSGTTSQSMALNVSGIDPAFTQNANGFLDNFAADLSGGFSDSGPSVVPEPATVVVWSLLGLTISGAGWWRRMRIA
jgi:hypothetical protein